MAQCSAVLSEDRLVITTGEMTWRFRWNHGHLISEELRRENGVCWPLGGQVPDCEFPGQDAPPTEGRLRVLECPATPVFPAHTEVEVVTRLGDLGVKRVFRLYPGCPAIGCDLYLHGRSAQPWRSPSPQNQVAATVMHRLRMPHPHLGIECLQFFDISDRRNNFVASHHVLPYRHPLTLSGNLLLCRDRLADRSLFLLKEAPCSDAQLASPGFDFVVADHELQVAGIGLLPEDFAGEDWVRGYGFAVGLAAGDSYELLLALRRYQACLRTRRPDRDDMVMLNTWGDRGQGERVTEDGVLKELAAAARLGVSHLQLDHGWESTQEAAKPWPLNIKNIWQAPHFWQVNPVRFPRGLQPCVEAARAVGIELCLWFNPSPEDDYAHWEDDAAVLCGLHRQYGIRTFKLDGVEIPTKAAELHFRRLLGTVAAAAGGEAVFNLDITAGQRFGYHYFTDAGNLFLENRYTDWRNYYPHWTLRNLWQLSRYVPAQNLQIEFLNPWRNAEHYPADDPLAPGRVPFAYCFAIAMMAQPLAWFEAANLPEAGFALAPLVRLYRKHQAAIHAGVILPIGEEPSGTGWTGFQSCRDDAGYLLVFREHCARRECRLPCWGLAGRRLTARHLAGSGQDFAQTAAADGSVCFALPDAFSFALYEYQVEA